MSSDSPRSGTSRWLAVLSLVAIIGAFAAMFVQRPPYVLAAGFARQPRSDDVSKEPLFETAVVSDSLTSYVHSATAADIGGGRIRACWMAGTSEGHADVAIHTSVLDPETGTWSPEQVMITPEWARRHLRRNVIALGNPMLMQHEDGRLILWFVSVAIGGWSGSSVNMTVSRDSGETWEPPVRLVTSPFFNLSTLVRQPAFTFDDGTLGLPVYHQCIGIFAELLRLDPGGRVLHKQRLSWGRSTLQPKIVALNEMEATGFLRRYGAAPRQVHGVKTSDGGRSWSSPRALDLPNPGAPVAVVRLDTGELKMVFNNTPKGRINLTLALSSDGGDSWRIIRTFDGDGTPEAAKDVSYPSIVQTSSGDFHVLYSADLNHIRHVHFNTAWLEQQR